MEISIISSAYFRIDDYVSGIKKLKEHGYNGVDYQDFINPKSPTYTFSFSKINSYYKEFNNVRKEEGIKVFQAHAIWPSVDITEKDREYTINELYKRAIDGCALMECRYLVCHPIFPFGTWDEVDKDLCYKINLEFFKKILPIAKQSGITLCLENLPFRTDLSKIETVKKFIDEINDENFKGCLDTGHANVHKYDIESAVKLFGKDLKALHVHDNMGDSDSHLLLGDGNIDWKKFVSALRETGFTGAFNLETKIGDSVIENREEKQIALFKSANKIANF